jgi:hypothetical protein
MASAQEFKVFTWIGSEELYGKRSTYPVHQQKIELANF